MELVLVLSGFGVEAAAWSAFALSALAAAATAEGVPQPVVGFRLKSGHS